MKCSRWTGLMVLAAALPVQAVPVTVAYTYDDLARLTKADYGTQGNVTYAYDRAGNITGSTSTLVLAETIPGIPAKPTATDGTDSSRVDITWTAANGATTYNVFRCTNATTATCGVALASPAGTGYADAAATVGNLYYYRLKACNSAGCSGYSPADTGWRSFAAPTAVVATDNLTGKVNITWSAPTNVGSLAPVYQVYRSTSATGTKTQLNVGTTINTALFSDSSAVLDTQYWYWLKACVSDGVRCSAFSSNAETGLALSTPPTPTTGQLLALGDLTGLATDQSTNRIRLSKLLVPDEGFKSGEFVWNAAQNAWVLNGALAADDPYYGFVQLWKLYEDQTTAQDEKISIYAGGVNVTGVQFKSPAGVTYSAICHAEDSRWGLNMFNCEQGGLPVGQTTFGAGKYVFTYTLASGAKVTRNFYVSGTYPAVFNITYPINGTANVSLTPNIKWTAFGSGQYDFIIRDANQNDVHSISFNNSTDFNLSHNIPANVLQPNTRYYLTIEAKGPVINGGSMGIKKHVEFTTTP